MSDDTLRAMARVDALGDDEERAGLLVALLRRGELSLAELKLRVWLYDPAARVAWEGLGELEVPPTLASVEEHHRQLTGRQRDRPFPQAYLRRLFGRSWSRGVAPLGIHAAARISLAAFRLAEERLAPELLPAAWEPLGAAAERWLSGGSDEVGDFDAFQHDLSPSGAEELRPARDVAQALAVTLGSMTPLGAAEGAGAALVRVATIWHSGADQLGDAALTAPDLQAALRRHLPPPRSS